MTRKSVRLELGSLLLVASASCLFVEEERARAEERARPHLGRSIGIRIPIEAGDAEPTYRFTLKVIGLLPRRISWA